MSEESSNQEQTPVNFSTFVISLASSAMVHLGQANDPATGALNPSRDLARSAINVLAMLENKTDGNLDKEESKLITTILYDLRMGFVQSDPKS